MLQLFQQLWVEFHRLQDKICGENQGELSLKNVFKNNFIEATKM